MRQSKSQQSKYRTRLYNTENQENQGTLKRNSSAAVPDASTLEGRFKLRTAAEGTRCRVTVDSAIISKDVLQRIRTESRLISQDEHQATQLYDTEQRQALWQQAQERKRKF